MCVELCAHAVITYVLAIREHFPNVQNYFLLWLLGSQTCESTF